MTSSSVSSIYWQSLFGKRKDEKCIEIEFIEQLERYKLIADDYTFEHGTLKWRLYGLSKQAVEGDYNSSLNKKDLPKQKVEAWHYYNSLPKISAMQSFIDEMNRLIPIYESFSSYDSTYSSSMGGKDKHQKIKAWKTIWLEEFNLDTARPHTSSRHFSSFIN